MRGAPGMALDGADSSRRQQRVLASTRLYSACRYLINTTAPALVARRIHDNPDSVLWPGFVMFIAKAMEDAHVRPACEVLLEMPADKLQLLLQNPKVKINRVREKMLDYVGRLTDRVIDGRILRVLEAAA